MQCPADVTLSPTEGEALMTRLDHDTCTRADRAVLVQIVRMHFWLLCVVQEATLSLKRLRPLLFGAPAPAAPAAPGPSSDHDLADKPTATPLCSPLAPPPLQGEVFLKIR